MSNKKMKRTQVFLPVVLVDKLDFLSSSFGVSKGEIIRSAIFEYISNIDEDTFEKLCYVYKHME